MNRLVAATLALTLGAAVTALAAPAQAAPARSVLRAGASLSVGQSLRSPDGAYTATLGRFGHFALRHGARVIWSRYAGTHPRVVLGRHGNLAVMSGRRTTWSTRTHAATELVLGNDGVLSLRSPGGTVWSNRIGNGCPPRAAGKRVIVDLGSQFARLCHTGTQLLATPITSGAVDLGDGTPTGTWRVQSKQRERYLYPAAGGSYYVHYWLPYDGAYGMHDSSWQRFPYGSPLYRTRGSHGCVHFPLAAIRWMYGWLPVGAVVRIHA